MTNQTSIPVSVLCVLRKNDEIKLIEQQCSINEYCWYPFGDRYQKLTEICNYLCKNEYFQIKINKDFILYESNNNQSLVFYLHKSRSQKGSATISEILLVDRIVISKQHMIQIKNKNLNPISSRQNSKVWIGIKQVKQIPTIDASNLEKHHLEREEHFKDKIYRYQHIIDGHKLYSSVIPIKAPKYI